MTSIVFTDLENNTVEDFPSATAAQVTAKIRTPPPKSRKEAKFTARICYPVPRLPGQRRLSTCFSFGLQSRLQLPARRTRAVDSAGELLAHESFRNLFAEKEPLRDDRGRRAPSECQRSPSLEVLAVKRPEN